MGRRTLTNLLELAYAPMCNYDFNMLKKDPIIQNILKESCIYIIAQRGVLSFENIQPIEEHQAIYFEIHQKGNPEILKVVLPFFQENLAQNPENEIKLYAGSNDPNNNLTELPLNNIHGIKFLEDDEFVVWFSPEKFLQNYWKGHFAAHIEGDYEAFTNYNVHYVGKATKQDIWKRLTGHATLQDILSVEYPLNYGDLPTHEIAILFLKFRDNMQIHTSGPNDDNIDEMVASLMGTNLPDKETIFLDAEKALIKAMDPKHNKEKYKSYPKSEDGLYKHGYDTFSYSFIDPISLNYDWINTINGANTPIGGDTIFVKDNKIIELSKN